MNIKHKHIVVTGAARGLGKAIATYLADKGANITLIDLNSATLQESSEALKSKGVTALALPADVSKEEEVVAAIQEAVEQQGPIHALINNAGILRDGLLVKAKEGHVISKMSYDQWQSVIDVNLTGVFLCGREVAANMIDSATAGIIINIASISRAGNFGQSNYAAAKAGVAALTTTWARELARYGIRSVAVAPGMIETEMTQGMKPEAQQKMTAPIPAGRMGTPGEIAHTIGFVIENNYFNGRVLELDGGLRL